MRLDTVIVGAGLAGSLAALRLTGTGSVLLADYEKPEAGSLAAVAAMANPLMARRAKAVHRAADALSSLAQIASETAAPVQKGILRPARTAKQSEHFMISAGGHPDLGTWLSPEHATAKYEWLHAPFGALHVHSGFSVQVPAFLAAVNDCAGAKGVRHERNWHLDYWKEHTTHVEVRFSSEEGPVVLQASRLVLALGAGFAHFESLRHLALHRIKGQLLRVEVAAPPQGVIAVSGGGYVVPEGEGQFVIGSSFEHEFANTIPRRAVSRNLLSRATSALPWLDGAAIISEHAGVRVTVPGTRLPMVGALPDHSKTWILTGLSSKGLLMSALIAQELPIWLNHPDKVPHHYAVRLMR